MLKKLLILMMSLPILLFGLTLQESIDFGLKNNKEIQIAEKEISEAKNDVDISKAKLFPQMSFTAGVQYKRDDLPSDKLLPKVNIVSYLDNSASHNDSLLANTMSFISNSMIPEKISTTTGLMGQFEFNQILFAGNKILNSIEISKKALQIKENNLKLKKQKIRNKIINSYNSILLLRKVLEINRDAMELANDHLSQVQSMFNNGVVSKYDLLRAKLEKSKLEPNIIESENNLNLAVTSFEKLIGISEKPVISGNLQIKVMKFNDENSLINEGLKNRLELKNSYLYSDILKDAVKVNKGNFLPNFILKADWQIYGGLDDFNFQKKEFGNTATVQVGFQYNLFSGKSDYSNLKKSKITLRKNQLNVSNLEDLITLQIKNNLKNYKKELANLKVNEENLKLAKKGFGIAEARYKNHLGIQLEVFDAQLQLKTAKLKYFQTKYNLIKAENDLLESIGK